MPDSPQPAPAPRASVLTRRSVLTAAAWSAPALALAVSAPAAAASGGGRLTVAFDATYIQLDHEATFVALVVITNSSGEALVDEPAEIVFSGFDPEAPLDFDASLPAAVDSSFPGYDPELPPQNALFSTAGVQGDTLTVISNGGISLPVGGTLVFALYLHRSVASPDFRFYTIAGVFTIGGFSGAVGSTQVDLVPPAP